MGATDGVEDSRHYMCQYSNDLYGQVRRAWYTKVKERVKGMSMKLWEVFVDTAYERNAGGWRGTRCRWVTDGVGCDVRENTCFVDEHSGRRKG